MAQNTRGQSSPPSYIDGISVKISERYKPPKRITLALSYSQRLTLNKLIHDPVPTYDFALEESIKSRVHEWRKVRVTIAEERKQRLHNLSQDRNTKKWNQNESDEVLTNKSNSDSDTPNSDISNNKESITDVSHTYYSTESGVLIPITVGSQQQSQPISRPIYQTEKGFNFSEFESDTSSPFDNMELKTINDLEELAEVLKRDSDNSILNSSSQSVHDHATNITNCYTTPQNNKNSNKENQINGYYYNHSPFTSKLMYGIDPSQSHVADLTNMQAREYSVRSVTEIMKSLQELASNRVTNKLPVVVETASMKIPEKSSIKTEPEDSLENPFNSLSSELQEMVRTISFMGFPLARVARACQALDGNQKKIVEHLLAMSDLLDLGFPEQKVVSALLKCNNDRDKALDLLIT